MSPEKSNYYSPSELVGHAELITWWGALERSLKNLFSDKSFSDVWYEKQAYVFGLISIIRNQAGLRASEYYNAVDEERIAWAEVLISQLNIDPDRIPLL